MWLCVVSPEGVAWLREEANKSPPPLPFWATSSRANSASELQDVDEEPGDGAMSMSMSMSTSMSAAAAAVTAAMVSAAGTGAGFGSTLTSTLTSTRSGEDDLDVRGFDPAELDEMYGGGGGVEGMLFQGHPSVEPKEEGGTDRYFDPAPPMIT